MAEVTRRGHDIDRSGLAAGACSMDPKLIAPLLVAALVVWGIVRRVRRNFGRQTVQPVRIWLRIGVLTVIGGLISTTGVMHDARSLEALIAGLACGLALGYLGLRHTRFEVTPGGRFYTPHTYIGLAVTALFVGRLVYRLFSLSSGANALGPAQNPALMLQKSPLTVAIFAVLIGYYLLFYAGVLLRTRAPAVPMRESSPGR
jgi:hypothetical protein